MNLEKYMVVSGIPGVHKLASTRSNGLLIEDSNEGRVRFITIRQNPVTPLGTIGIYVDTDEGQDTVSLGEVFQMMLDQQETHPLVSANATGAELRAYFTSVLPNHDQDRVHINDIKKCVKWFGYMLEKGIFDAIKAEAAADAAATSEETDAVSADAAEKATTAGAEEAGADAATNDAPAAEEAPDEPTSKDEL